MKSVHAMVATSASPQEVRSATPVANPGSPPTQHVKSAEDVEDAALSSKRSSRGGAHEVQCDAMEGLLQAVEISQRKRCREDGKIPTSVKRSAISKAPQHKLEDAAPTPTTSSATKRKARRRPKVEPKKEPQQNTALEALAILEKYEHAQKPALPPATPIPRSASAASSLLSPKREEQGQYEVYDAHPQLQSRTEIPRPAHHPDRAQGPSTSPSMYHEAQGKWGRGAYQSNAMADAAPRTLSLRYEAAETSWQAERRQAERYLQLRDADLIGDGPRCRFLQDNMSTRLHAMAPHRGSQGARARRGADEHAARMYDRPGNVEEPLIRCPYHERPNLMCLRMSCPETCSFDALPASPPEDYPRFEYEVPRPRNARHHVAREISHPPVTDARERRSLSHLALRREAADEAFLRKRERDRERDRERECEREREWERERERERERQLRDDMMARESSRLAGIGERTAPRRRRARFAGGINDEEFWTSQLGEIRAAEQRPQFVGESAESRWSQHPADLSSSRELLHHPATAMALISVPMTRPCCGGARFERVSSNWTRVAGVHDMAMLVQDERSLLSVLHPHCIEKVDNMLSCIAREPGLAAVASLLCRRFLRSPLPVQGEYDPRAYVLLRCTFKITALLPLSSDRQVIALYAKLEGA
mmetsp:Transcript_18949/g.71717  ORF Transcript_18949/g.71717 Transcript_18949/m.71717 type:complete len:652 (-) Transcript_18949:260-2215(-)